MALFLDNHIGLPRAPETGPPWGVVLNLYFINRLESAIVLFAGLVSGRIPSSPNRMRSDYFKEG